MDLDFLRRAWLNHLGIDSNFPRDMGFPERRKVYNWWQYVRTIELNMHCNNIYVALYSDNNIQKGLWDKLFFDVDAHDGSLPKAHLDMLRLYDYIQSNYGVEPRLYFTGHGFAVYFDFEPVSIDKWSVKVFGMDIIRKAGCKQVDTTPLGDKRRISRIPYTYNLKTDDRRMCIPISVDWDLDTILDEASKPTKLLDVKVQPAVVEIPVYEWDMPEYDAAITNLDYIDDELVLFIYKNAHKMTDGRKRLIHFVLVPTFVHKYGMTRNEVHVLCRLFIEKSGADYEEYESYVESSITRTLRDGWKPWSMDYFIYNYPELREFVEKEE